MAHAWQSVSWQRNPILWLAFGLVLGVLISGFWPHTPLHAVATDRFDNFAIATGPMDEAVEAIFFLDFLTGDLRAAVIGDQTGTFTSFYQYNILQDLEVDPSKNPRFLMVTGYADLRRGSARMRPGRGVVYVAELTSGKVAAYAVPWNPQARAAGQVFKGSLIRLDVTQFRTAAVRRTE